MPQRLTAQPHLNITPQSSPLEAAVKSEPAFDAESCGAKSTVPPKRSIVKAVTGTPTPSPPRPIPTPQEQVMRSTAVKKEMEQVSGRGRPHCHTAARVAHPT